MALASFSLSFKLILSFIHQLNLSFKKTYVHECFVCIYVRTPHVCLVQRKSDEVVDFPSELKLTVVSCLVGAGHLTWVLCQVAVLLIAEPSF